MIENPHDEKIMSEPENTLLFSGFARRVDELIEGQRHILERLERLRVLRERRGKPKKK